MRLAVAVAVLAEAYPGRTVPALATLGTLTAGSASALPDDVTLAETGR